MKRNVEAMIVSFLSVFAAQDLDAQAYVRFDNLPPADGLVYLLSDMPGGLLLNQDVNFQLFGGSDPFNRQVIHTWLLSDGSASGINVAPGRFADPTDGVYSIPGVQPGGTAYLELWAWTGSVDTFEAALRVGAAGGTAFPNLTGTAGSAPGLTGMNSFLIGIPEPSSLALLGLGGLGLVAALTRRLDVKRDSRAI